MISSSFRKQSLEEVKEKQALKMARLALKPRKAPKPRTILKNTATGQKTTKKRKPRAKLPTVKSMRNKCDSLLTPIIKKLYPNCLLTGEDTQVAHHFIKKSTSSALRYYLPNLIPLTHYAHLRLHSDEILWTARIIATKGLDWWNDLEEKKNVYTKCDVHFYIENHKRLTQILEEM